MPITVLLLSRQRRPTLGLPETGLLISLASAAGC
jgi:hypothetical protein